MRSYVAPREYPLPPPSLVKLVEDLVIKGVVPLAEQTSPHVKFCAVDLAKVPRFAPEEVNMNSLLMRVQKLETSFGKLEKLESTCNSNANDIKRVWTSLQSSGPSVRRQTPYVANAPPSSPLQCSLNACDVDSMAPSAEFSGRQSSLASYAGALRAPMTKNADGQIVSSSTQSQQQSDKWQQQREQRRRLVKDANSRMKVVTGRKAGSELKVASINRTIYLSKVDMDYTEDDVKTMMDGSEVNVRYIRQINGKRGLGLKKSFMIVINEKDYDKTMSEDFWPMGLECREWLNQEQLKAIVNQNGQQTYYHVQ